MIDTVITGNISAWLLVFARVGGAFMVLPGFGSSFVNMRIRLVLALALSLVLVPVMGETLPARPDSTVALAMLLIQELIIGIFFGTVARMLITALETAGMVISMQMGLANAFMFNAQLEAQTSLPSVLLTTLGMVLIFVTDLHHLLIMGLVDTYRIFEPGMMLPIGDAAWFMARTLADSFRIGAQLAAPFIIVGVLFDIGLGVLARLMPQVQIFFVGLPLRIAIGIVLMSVTVGAIGLYWVSAFEDRMFDFLGNG